MSRKINLKSGAAALFALAALVLCIVMAVHSLSGGGLVGCGAGSSCDSVLGGKWSTLLGIVPVSALAAGVYLAWLLAWASLTFSSDAEVKDLASRALLLLSGAILGAAVWFIGLQIFAEGSLCKYCMSAHALGIVCSVLTLLEVRPSVGKWRGWLSIGLGLAVLLAVFQVLTAPDVVYQDGRGEEAFPLLSVDEAPVVGNPDAEHVVNLLFDYQCSHCRKVHGQLEEVIRRMDGRVAFVLCPCPLSPRCNPYVPREETRFEGSCDLARLALAVYSIDPQAFYEFDAWLFGEGEDGSWRPRAVDAAREHAAGLVGAERLAAAYAAPALSETIRQATDLFGRTTVKGSASIPRFVHGDRWIVPSTDDADDLVTILQEEFGIN